MHGCKKDFVTVKNWVTNNEMIIPNEIEDLMIIARATGDDILLEMVEKILAAGKYVRSIHTKAGKILSDRLKEQIPHELQTMKEMDPYNVWDPISLNVDDIGVVKILKVIDVGELVSVETGYTNRLITEWG